MEKIITKVHSVSTMPNGDGAKLELRKIKIDYMNSKRESAEGYTLVWVYENGKEFPPEPMGQVIFSEKDILELLVKASRKEWFWKE